MKIYPLASFAVGALCAVALGVAMAVTPDTSNEEGTVVFPTSVTDVTAGTSNSCLVASDFTISTDNDEPITVKQDGQVVAVFSSDNSDGSDGGVVTYTFTTSDCPS